MVGTTARIAAIVATNATMNAVRAVRFASALRACAYRAEEVASRAWACASRAEEVARAANTFASREEVCFHNQPFVPRRPLGREPACNNFIFFTSHLTKLSCGDPSTNSINSL